MSDFFKFAKEHPFVTLGMTYIFVGAAVSVVRIFSK